MNPVNSISELIRLLKSSSGKQLKSSALKKGTYDKPVNSDISASANLNSVADEIKLKVREEVHRQGGVSDETICVFIETVIMHKMIKVDEGLDVKKLSRKIANVIKSDPEINAKLQKLIIDL